MRTDPTRRLGEDPFRGEHAVVLVLGGGNALGAYHLGACGRLFEADLAPDLIVGTSIGAVTGAILAGNPPETRLDRLRSFWDGLAQAASVPLDLPPRLRARTGELALLTLLVGRPGLFSGRFPGPWSVLPGMPADRALRDHAPLARTLERLIDFGRLRTAPERLLVPAIDMESGAEVWFDSRAGDITPEVLLAATALAPIFPPVEIGGRLLCDAGFANNLPLDRVFRDPPERDTLCIAIDLFDLGHGRPETLDETLLRVKDLAFASQTRRSLAALARERVLSRRLDGDSAAVVVAHLAQRSRGHQVALKTFDFTRASIEERVAAGRADAEAMLARLAGAGFDRPLTYLGPLDLPG